ncbi:hypothetical protein ACCO45_010702 [Purpureocillium lilacinum]|uniref:Uncharacterized protein n=1 Tax=Purpureocillium lilacinum TaxID=33203 RepID=A0ACC4DHV7_PURLI
MNLVASSERTQRRLRQRTILGVLCFALLMQPQVTIALRPPTIAPQPAPTNSGSLSLGRPGRIGNAVPAPQRTVARLSDRRLLVMIDAPAKLISDRRGANMLGSGGPSVARGHDDGALVFSECARQSDTRACDARAAQTRYEVLLGKGGK